MRPTRFSLFYLLHPGCTLLFLLIGFFCQGQDTLTGLKGSRSGLLVIRKIILSGNKITHDRIITRELKFRENDTVSLPDLQAAMRASQHNVFNTNLFNFVTIDTLNAAGTGYTDVKVSVVERWYIWPIPLFEISERNFNVWWATRDFRRLTYGIDFTFYNFRGRNETLRILAHFGYNQLYGFTYKIPYLNKKQTIGMGVGAGVEFNHELAVATVDNKPVNKKDSSAYLRKIIYGYAEMQYRPSFHSTHSFRLSYNFYTFGGNIVEIPGFSLSNNSEQHFFTISYYFRNDHRDASYFPLKGYCIDLELNHTFPYETAHNSYIRTNLREYLQLHRKWYYATGFTGKMTFARSQPYFLQRGLGYGQDFVRGYEYFVVDGQHYALWKNDLKFALVPQQVLKLGFIKTTKFNTIPFAFYLDLFADAGYVYNYQRLSPEFKAQGNNLENSLLGGVGLGLDFTTYYDVVFRLEGSVNRKGQTGFSLHFSAPI